ncbi:hypothetical protein ACSBR1_022793 [Camellia fascicularis]
MSVILSTTFVFLTRADKYGVKIVKHIKGGLNPISVHQLQFNSSHASEVAKIGLIVAVVALTVHSSSLFIPFHLFFNIIHEHFEFLVKSVSISVPTSGSHCGWLIFCIHKRIPS